jgi:periplasmic copper chaperone A
MFRIFSLAAVAALSAFPAIAHDGVHIEDAWARFLPGARTGVVYMTIENHSTTDDRLTAAISRIAERVELHQSMTGDDGMATMTASPDGMPIAGGATARLEPGGWHLMFMGLTTIPADGETVPVTLVFDHAGEVTLDIPVDNRRKPGAAMDGMEGMDHDTDPPPAAEGTDGG